MRQFLHHLLSWPEAALKPLEDGGLRAVCHADFPQDRSLLDAWDELSRTAGTPFSSPVWQAGLFDLANPQSRPRLITVQRGPDLLAVLPLEAGPDASLRSPGQPLSDYLEPLIHPDHQHDCWRMILRLLATSRRVKKLRLHNLRQSASCRRVLPELSPQLGWKYHEEVAEMAPCIALPATFDEFWAALDGHERTEKRRRLKNAETRGRALLVIPKTDAEIASSLEIFLQMLETSPGEKSQAARKTLRPFLLRVAPPLILAHRLELLLLQIDGHPAAGLMQFPSPSGPLLYNTGFDPAARPWSPGVVAILLAIRRAIEQHAAEYDLMRGNEEYKYRLGAVDRPMYTITLGK